MPEVLHPIVEKTLRSHFDLNVLKQLKEYKSGPVMFVKRLRDEIICVEPGNQATNRGIDLALGLLKHRYPKVFRGEALKAAKSFAEANSSSEASRIASSYQYREGDAELDALIGDHVQQKGADFPSLIDATDDASRIKLALHLVSFLRMLGLNNDMYQ
ncbi:unnamed protein product, partial [Notodromas monacha]